MHPRCRHIGETYLNVDFSSSALVKFNFEPSRKKNQIFGSHVDKARAISFLGVRKVGVRTEFNFVDFQLFEKNSHFWVSMVKY